MIDRFKERAEPSTFLKPSWQRVDLRDALNPWFFTAAPFGSQPGGAKIERIRLSNKKLRLDLASPTGAYKASVWIDLKTWNVVNVVQDGKS